ncbi:MAG: F0F1 ATP synthase subunit A [Alphaproteobacteria bacterium]|nr:F0F1 ATP synthase subunit A [Alphaproteobacteria bacterium]
MQSPLELTTLFHIGPVAITTPVATTWAIMLAFAVLGGASTRRLSLLPSRFQALLEILVEALDSQIKESIPADPTPYRALIGTIFFYILAANWSSLIPGVKPPTAHIETDIALAGIVFFAAIYYGVRAQGVGGYLLSFTRPTILMTPLNIAEAFTRTFSMSVRLFGNVMSGVVIIGLVLSLAGLFVPIPLMALDLLVGAIQAYIFAVLSMVFIAGAVSGEKIPHHTHHQKE